MKGSFAISLLILSMGLWAAPHRVELGIASNFSQIVSSSSNPYSNYFLEGVKLALKHSREKLKRRSIELVLKEFDYGTDVINVRKTVREAAKSSVLAVLGYNYSSYALMAAPLHQEAKLPMLTPSATADRLGQMGSYIHSGCFNNSFMASVLAEIAVKKLKAKTITSVVVQDCAYCKDLSNSFKKEFIMRGGKILEEIGILENSHDLGAIAGRVKILNPDAVFVPNQEVISAQVISHILKAGVSKPFLGGDGWGNDGQLFFKVLNGQKIEAHTLSHWHKGLKDPVSRRFLADYEREFKKEPNDTSVLAYDSMLLFIEVLLSAEEYTREGIEKSFNRLKQFEAVTGKFRFSSTGAVKKSLVLLSASDNGFKVSERIHPKGEK